MKAKIFQLHKRSSYVFSEIQDKYSINTTKKVFSLADGATQGFKSEIWAEFLVDSFKEKPCFSVMDLVKQFEEKAIEFAGIEHQYSDNFAIKSLEKRKQESGSFATFMGVRIDENEVSYISSGDVCLFIVRANKVIDSFPFATVENLDSDKGFIGTVKLLSGKQELENFYFKTFLIENNDIVILTTDAIARYILKSGNTEFFQNEDFEGFKEYIMGLWESNLLEEDDISVIEISQISSKDFIIEEVLPPEDFSFPKSEMEKVIKLKPDLLESQQMTELQNQIGKLKKKQEESDELYQNEVQTLRKKLKRLRLLTFFLLGSLLLGLTFFFARNFLKKPMTEKNQKVLTDEKLQKRTAKSLVEVDSLSNKKDSIKK